MIHLSETAATLNLVPDATSAQTTLMLTAVAVICVWAVHHWTMDHHDKTLAPNWTLLFNLNWIFIVVFFLSIFMLFRSSTSDKSVWVVLSLITVVYFFSIFGVWFVHSLLESDVESLEVFEHAEPEKRSESPPASPREQVTSPKPKEISRECLREVLAANDRLNKAHNEDEAWGVADNLWRLTQSGDLTVEVLQGTRIGKTVGNFCKRTCGKCCQASCQFCELVAAWKHMCWTEINASPSNASSAASQNPALQSPQSPLAQQPAPVVSLPSAPPAHQRRNSFSALRNCPSRSSLQTIPEVREHTDSCESLNPSDIEESPRRPRQVPRPEDWASTARFELDAPQLPPITLTSPNPSTPQRRRTVSA